MASVPSLASPTNFSPKSTLEVHGSTSDSLSFLSLFTVLSPVLLRAFCLRAFLQSWWTGDNKQPINGVFTACLSLPGPVEVQASFSTSPSPGLSPAPPSSSPSPSAAGSFVERAADNV